MWLCFNDGFLSVVADTNDPNRLMARARRKVDLTNIFGANAEILETPGHDYRWRTFIDREAFKALVSSRLDNINYPNFKNSVEDEDLHDLYSEFWVLHRKYGTNDPSVRPGAKKLTRKGDRSSHFAWGPGDIEIHPPKG